ncbi:MAG TPA: hypothetical protein DCZ10_13945 [Pelotomaculum sp.]|nr:hypothetical protein [Pelotomaculum sp.]
MPLFFYFTRLFNKQDICPRSPAIPLLLSCRFAVYVASFVVNMKILEGEKSKPGEGFPGDYLLEAVVATAA